MAGVTASPAARGTASAASLRLEPITPLPERLAVGQGNAIFLDGLCSHPDGPVSDLRVSIDGADQPALATGMPPPGSFQGDDYWWAIVTFEAVSRPRLARLRVRARTARGADAVGDLGMIELHPSVDVGLPAPAPRSRGAAHDGALPASGRPLIAIAMATYEPPLDLFEQQIASIREQTYDNWVCVISDDHSSPERLAEMRRILGDDERFSLTPGAERLGFYANFERALALTPPDAAYVGMSDQDDRWYPEKLEVLQANAGTAKLVYSDMRIVDRGGRVRFDTYWSYRRNNHTNFGSLLVANTITGAASLFPREVLDYALPFPPRYGDNYHDHWVALVAMSLGQVAYVDRPLYDYIQHDGAVLGHAGANGRMRRGFVAPESAATRALRAGKRAARIALLRVPRGMRHFYFAHYCGTAITAKVAELRCGPVMAPAKRRTLRRLSDPERTMAWLALRSPRRWLGHTETLRHEQALLGGLAWRRYAEWRKRLAGRRVRGARPLAGPELPSAAALAPQMAPAVVHTNGASALTDETWLTPILVDYFTRDGSTLMMRLLATSPQVAVEEQYPYERKYFNYLWRWSRMLDRGHWPSETWSPRALASITQERHVSLVGPPPWHPRTLTEGVPGEEPMSRRCFELAWHEFSARAARASAADPAGVRYYAEKHLDTWVLDPAELPAFELLVLLRDPRDTYVSIRAFNEKRGTAGFGRARVSTDREHIDQLLARQRERLRWIADLLAQADSPVIRYDDLVLDAAGVARRLEQRLGIELDADAARADAHMRKAHVSASSPERSVGRWREELDAETVKLFARELGDELEAVGFEV